MYRDFPFTIVDVAYLLNLHARHKNAASLDVDCPFCGEKKGKLNLNTKKNVFKCNRCGGKRRHALPAWEDIRVG